MQRHERNAMTANARVENAMPRMTAEDFIAWDGGRPNAKSGLIGHCARSRLPTERTTRS
jgi:hypothetical protein